MANIRVIWLRLPELQKNNLETKKLKNKNLSKGEKDVKSIFQYYDLLYIMEIIYFKVIRRQHDNTLVGHFAIHKTREQIV